MDERLICVMLTMDSIIMDIAMGVLETERWKAEF